MKNKKRLHFGVVFSTIDNTCLYEIWRGIAEFAKMKDIHLTAYFGTYQTNDYDFASHLEACFETIRSSESLDGVILFAGFLAQHIGIDNFEEYAAEIPGHIPAVSVSFSMPGMPSVLVDNVGGIYIAVEHLIKVHGKKKIAFVKGPDGHPEADDRLAGYKKALAANGIPLDEAYILPGFFTQKSGRDAVVEMIDVRKLSVDAIVASDDESAIGVLNELESRGIMVPTDIAVTGFDDDRFSATFIPSISTVRQGFFDIGLASAETLCQIISGEQIDGIRYVTPAFVARQSCGCFEKDLLISESKLSAVPLETDTIIAYVLNNSLPLFPQNVPQKQIQEWVAELVGKIRVKPFCRIGFLQLFDEVLVNYIRYSKDFSLWYEVLNYITMGVEFHADEVECVHTVLSTLFLATTLVYDIRLKKEKTKEFHVSDARLLLRRIANALILRFDIDSLAEELHKSLPELSLHTAFVGLYRSPVKSNDSKADRTIETVLGFDGDKRISVTHKNTSPIRFSDYSTIKGFDFESERRTFFFIPLFFDDEELGITILPYDSQIPVEAYENLRISISTAVKGAELLARIRTLSITDELTGLLNRRGFFQFAYSRMPYLSRDTERLPFVMYMDMDGLKYINDTYGHKEGDAAISTFAGILKDTLREEDIIGRMGGDEFVVFSSVKSEKDGEQVVKRVRDGLVAYNKKKLRPYEISACIGNVVLDEPTNECFEAAMLSADSFLYEEKTEKRKKGLARE